MMKNIILTLLVVSAISFGCKKETKTIIKEEPKPIDTTGGNPGITLPTYYIYARINGVETVFKAVNFLKDDPDNPGYVYLIGYSEAGPPQKLPSITFTLKKPDNGFFNGLSYTLDEKDLSSFVNYMTANMYNYKSTATPASATSGLRITFDKMPMTPGEIVEGVFSGTLQLEENTSTITITNGKFKTTMFN